MVPLAPSCPGRPNPCEIDGLGLPASLRGNRWAASYRAEDMMRAMACSKDNRFPVTPVVVTVVIRIVNVVMIVVSVVASCCTGQARVSKLHGKQGFWSAGLTHHVLHHHTTEGGGAGRFKQVVVCVVTVRIVVATRCRRQHVSGSIGGCVVALQSSCHTASKNMHR